MPKKTKVIEVKKEDIIPPSKTIPQEEVKNKIEKSTGSSNTVLKIGIGLCLGCLVVIIIVFWFLIKTGKFLINKAGQEINKQENLYVPTKFPLNIQTSEGLPSGFPADFPIYPKAKITKANSAVANEKKGFLVNLETSDSITIVKDFYQTNLTKNNWQIENSFGNESGTFLTVKKGELTGLISLFPSKQKGILTISLVLGGI